MRWKWLFIPAVLASCGGNEPAPLDPALQPVDESALHVEVVALVKVARPLDEVVARITNHSAEVVYESLCDGGLEGFGYVPGQWNLSFGVARACPLGGSYPTGSLRSIESGASVLETFHVNSQSYAGSWRFYFHLQDREGDLLPLQQRVSQPFTVIR
jgi:hypothetical protein